MCLMLGKDHCGDITDGRKNVDGQDDSHKFRKPKLKSLSHTSCFIFDKLLSHRVTTDLAILKFCVSISHLSNMKHRISVAGVYVNSDCEVSGYLLLWRPHCPLN